MMALLSSLLSHLDAITLFVYPPSLRLVGPFSLTESLLRLTTTLPLSLISSYQSTCLSMLYMYIMFQVVGLLWAFITNAAVSFGMHLAVSLPQIHNDLISLNMTIRKREIIATFYVIYSTFRVVMKFLNTCVAAVWQSLNDFPKPRRLLTKFADRKRFSIIAATLIPVLFISSSLILTGFACPSTATPNPLLLNVVDKIALFLQTYDKSGTTTTTCSTLTINSLHYFCAESPFSYLSLNYDLPRRILTYVLLLVTWQYSIVVMSQFPTWRSHIKKYPTVHALADLLTLGLWIATTLFLLDAIWTFVVTTNLIAHLQEARLGARGFTDVAAVAAAASTAAAATAAAAPSKEVFEHLVITGQVLMLGWLLWIGSVVLAMCAISTPTLATLATGDDSLKTMFKHLKYTFLMFVFLIFALEMVHPDFGFIDAQITLTLLTLVVPAFQVTLGMCVFNAMQSSALTFLIGLPSAACLSGIAVYYSRAGGPGSFFIVTLHVFTKILQFFGTEITDQGPRDRARSSSSSSGSKSRSPVRHQRAFTMFGRSVSSHALASEAPMSPVIQEEDSDASDSETVNSPSPKKMLPVALQKELKLKATRTSRTNLSTQKHIVGGLARFGSAFAVIMALFMGFVAVTSHVQGKAQWYPDLIDIVSDSEEGTLRISHAYVAKLKLTTKGLPGGPLEQPPVPVPPHYASCSMKWYGLSLLDYALLSEAAYYDPDNSDMDEVIGLMFDPRGERREQGLEPLFEVRVPPKEQRQRSVAQYVEAYSKELNVSVIAIRGTDVGRMSDIVEDVKIFKEPVLLSMLSVVFPTIRIWPDSVSAFVIHALHETLGIFGLGGEAEYYKGVLTYVRSIKDRQVVLTGHSLGGGLARIVAAIEHLPNIAFSPPGVAQSYYKFVYNEFKTDEELRAAGSMLHHNSVAIVPENDPVTIVDTQVGLIQRIGCVSSSQAMQNACHMLEGTISELLTRCGDDRGRFTAGEFKFGLGEIMQRTLKMSIEHKTSVMAGLAMLLILGLMFVLPEVI